ncbi:VWA domain-containing protein [Aquabacter sp. CN5-332]|uniref:VWA domain-containing protein n=1 Tax=Aquabacter sp. CN5-332 TaxID=3156608 RepID=UPI0032B3FEFD
MTELLANAHFLRPWWLLLLGPAVMLWWLERRALDPAARWRGVIDPVLLRNLTVGVDAARRFAPKDLLLAGWILGIVAISGLTFRQEPSPFAAAARPAMFVLKVTPSMLTEDLKPTRLDRARQKMADLLGLREGAPTGLIAYAGSAHLVLPPTPDGSVIATMAQALSPGIMPKPGDALAAAVELAAKVLSDGGEGGSIVVFADTSPADQVTRLREMPNLVILPMELPERAQSDPGWRELRSDLVPLSLDTSDVTSIARRLESGPAPAVPGEGQRWQEAGYWLTPLIALLVLGWFRRGWVLA